MKNEEIAAIKKIVGLQQGKKYESTNALRYGHIMIMTDQDTDVRCHHHHIQLCTFLLFFIGYHLSKYVFQGSHIKGLIINMLHHYWPELLRLRGFVTQFITPIVKCTKGKQVKTFFTIPSVSIAIFLFPLGCVVPEPSMFCNAGNMRTGAMAWATLRAGRSSTSSLSSSWSLPISLSYWSLCRYYKGLGTSTSKEAKEYFSNLLKVRILVHPTSWPSPSSLSSSSSSCSTVLSSFALRMTRQTMNVSTWPSARLVSKTEKPGWTASRRALTSTIAVAKSPIQNSLIENSCSSPGMITWGPFPQWWMDWNQVNEKYDLNTRRRWALSPSPSPSPSLFAHVFQILFSCFKRRLSGEIKVAQLAGYVSEHSAYHHGEQSLCTTIVGMAQNFVGAHNVNTLLPIGQFGTRHQQGKDSASPRYIFTGLSPVTYVFCCHHHHLHYHDHHMIVIVEHFFPMLMMFCWITSTMMVYRSNLSSMSLSCH